MSNLAVDELVEGRRESGTVVNGLFGDGAVSTYDTSVLGARRWKGRTRLTFFLLAVLGSWTLVVFTIYMLF